MSGFSFPGTFGFYLCLVGFVVVLRLAELALAKRNANRLMARGAIEAGRPVYPWMVAVHTLWLIACVAEVWWLDRPWKPALGWLAVAALVAAWGLKAWAVGTLGERWTTRVLTLPGEPPVRRGPYQWFRHPNYLAVIIEIAALPLVHSAWLTALAFSFANALVLRARIRDEEEALAQASAEYRTLPGRFGGLFPGNG